MIRRLVPLLLAPLLTSCQPPDIFVHAAFVGGVLAFVPAEPGEGDVASCWREGVVVDPTLQPAWRFTAPGTGECGGLFPLFYGKPPGSAANAAPPQKLEPGRLYLFIGDATGSVSGAFALSRAGGMTVVHNVDPDSPAAAALVNRWWASRNAGGAS